jgi:hypothetical protein
MTSGVPDYLSTVHLSPDGSAFTVSVLVGEEVIDASLLSVGNPILIEPDGSDPPAPPVSLDVTFAPSVPGTTTATLVLESDAQNFEPREGTTFGTLTLGLIGSSD